MASLLPVFAQLAVLAGFFIALWVLLRYAARRAPGFGAFASVVFVLVVLLVDFAVVVPAMFASPYPTGTADPGGIRLALNMILYLTYLWVLFGAAGLIAARGTYLAIQNLAGVQYKLVGVLLNVLGGSLCLVGLALTTVGLLLFTIGGISPN